MKDKQAIDGEPIAAQLRGDEDLFSALHELGEDVYCDSCFEWRWNVGGNDSVEIVFHADDLNHITVEATRARSAHKMTRSNEQLLDAAREALDACDMSDHSVHMADEIVWIYADGVRRFELGIRSRIDFDAYVVAESRDPREIAAAFRLAATISNLESPEFFAEAFDAFGSRVQPDVFFEAWARQHVEHAEAVEAFEAATGVEAAAQYPDAPEQCGYCGEWYQFGAGAFQFRDHECYGTRGDKNLEAT